METEIMDSAIKTMLPVMFHLMGLMVGVSAIRAALSLFDESSKEKRYIKDTERKITKVKKTSLKEEIERVENLKKLGFENELEIKVFNPQRETVWIKDFSVDYGSSTLTVKDNKGRTYCCSINNIEKIKVKNLESGKTDISEFSYFAPSEKFWLPINSDLSEIEQDDDWCDF